MISSLDLKSGYLQVEVDEVNKPPKTFTVGPLGFYECEHMPFGLTNANVPKIDGILFRWFTTTMVYHLSGWHDFLLKNTGEHIKHLRRAFQKLAEAGFKVKAQ